MKKIICIVVLLVAFCSVCFAESYLVIDKKTKEVKSLSPEQDCVILPGWEEIVLEGEFKDIELQYHPTYYKYKNERFIANTKKLSDEAIAQEERVEKEKEEELVRKKMRKMAIQKLKEEGWEPKHISEED